ncbi:MAG: hypothetical protein LBQ12_06295 [Deltaproteobacteria bacterium]|jgi:hypothetical protein|nr:hypothetical protein [Deltaproteobacteria bacterium]
MAFRKALENGSAELDRCKQDWQKPSFRVVAPDWADKRLPALAPKTRQKSQNFLDEKILPFIGDLPLTDIGPQTVLSQVLRPIEARCNIETLHKAKSLLSQIFRYAVANGLVELDFTLDLKGAFTPASHVHRAAITDPGGLGFFSGLSIPAKARP